MADTSKLLSRSTPSVKCGVTRTTISIGIRVPEGRPKEFSPNVSVTAEAGMPPINGAHLMLMEGTAVLHS